MDVRRLAGLVYDACKTEMICDNDMMFIARLHDSWSSAYDRYFLKLRHYNITPFASYYKRHTPYDDSVERDILSSLISGAVNILLLFAKRDYPKGLRIDLSDLAKELFPQGFNIGLETAYGFVEFTNRLHRMSVYENKYGYGALLACIVYLFVFFEKIGLNFEREVLRQFYDDKKLVEMGYPQLDISDLQHIIDGANQEILKFHDQICALEYEFNYHDYERIDSGGKL